MTESVIVPDPALVKLPPLPEIMPEIEVLLDPPAVRLRAPKATLPAPVRSPTVWLLPDAEMSKAVVLLRVMASVALRLPPDPSANVPFETVMPPVCVLVPVSVRVPAPDFVNTPVPLNTPDNVLLWALVLMALLLAKAIFLALVIAALVESVPPFMLMLPVPRLLSLATERMPAEMVVVPE